jgi:tRNA threonylcarbamoyladenosine biosynthesis protein TsaB
LWGRLVKILALDTATSSCSVAFWADGVKACRTAAIERGHAEALMPMVVEVMAEAGVAFADVDLVAVTVGPGSFTGLRIGLAAARGMALAAGLPCLGITTLEAVAESIDRRQQANEVVLAALDSKRGDIFAQAFAAVDRPLDPPVAVSVDDLHAIIPAGTTLDRPVVVVGSAAETAVRALTDAGRQAVAAAAAVPVASAVAAIAARRHRRGAKPGRPPSPLYLRPPDTGPVHGGLPSR